MRKYRCGNCNAEQIRVSEMSRAVIVSCCGCVHDAYGLDFEEAFRKFVDKPIPKPLPPIDQRRTLETRSEIPQRRGQ